MSQWTHVAGIIRIDALQFMNGGDVIRNAISASFGETASFGDPEEQWEACSVPCGSEGSLQYHVSRSSYGDNAMSWGQVAIWGDLRDYDDETEIVEWLQGVVDKGKKAMIYMARGFVVLIDIEGRDNVIAYLDEGGDTVKTKVV